MSAKIMNYICACKCRVPELKRFRDRRNGRDITRRVCPEHYLDEAYIVGYVCQCSDCGKEFEDEGRKERCPECHKKNGQENNRRGQKKYSATHKGKTAAKKATKKFKAKQPAPESLEDQSRVFCANRAKCLEGYKNKPHIQYLPCKNCKDYVIQHGNHDPLVMRAAS